MYDASFWRSKRFFVAVLTFFGQICNFSLLANINIAIVEMTTNRTITVDNRTVIHPAEFDWDSRKRSLIVSAHAYGGLTALFGGFLALKYGGSTMIAVGSLLSAVLNLLNPIVVRYNFYLYWLVRALDGAGAVLKFVSVSELWSQWSPIQDRSKLIAIGFSGMYAGSTVVYLFCGFIIEYFGWPAAFYSTGGITLLWTLLWYLLVPNDPADDKWISKEELAYIKSNKKHTKPNKSKEIWKNMIKSKAIWALCSAKFVYNGGFIVIVTFLPMFIEDVTEDEIEEVGILASIPNVVAIFSMPLFGYAIDTLQIKGLLTTTQTHKLFLCVGFVCGSIFLFLTAYFAAKITIALMCLTIFKIMLSLSYVVLVSIVVSLAPQCSSVVTGFITIFYQLSAIVSPLLVGFIVTDHNVVEWSICFCIVAVIFLIGALIFFVCGTSEPQPWAHAVENINDYPMSVQNKVSR